MGMFGIHNNELCGLPTTALKAQHTVLQVLKYHHTALPTPKPMPGGQLSVMDSPDIALFTHIYPKAESPVSDVMEFGFCKSAFF